MQEIDATSLKDMIDAGGDMKLVAIMSEFGFEAMHIDTSIKISSPDELKALDPDDQIVLYCSDINCFASKLAARSLEEAGFANITHFPGGLSAWEAAGYPVKGTLAP